MLSHHVAIGCGTFDIIIVIKMNIIIDINIIMDTIIIMAKAPCLYFNDRMVGPMMDDHFKPENNTMQLQWLPDPMKKPPNSIVDCCLRPLHSMVMDWCLRETVETMQKAKVQKSTWKKSPIVEGYPGRLNIITRSWKGLHKSLLCPQRGIFTGFVFKLNPIFFFLYKAIFYNFKPLGLISRPHIH